MVAAQVTGLNTLRVLPLYLGAFILMEQYVPVGGPWPQRILGYFIPALLVPLSYLAIRVVFGTPYDFGVPAMLSLLGVIVVYALLLAAGVVSAHGHLRHVQLRLAVAGDGAAADGLRLRPRRPSST